MFYSPFPYSPQGDEHEEKTSRETCRGDVQETSWETSRGDEPGRLAGETMCFFIVYAPPVRSWSLSMSSLLAPVLLISHLFPIPVTYPELKLNPVPVSSLPLLLPCPVSYPEKDQHFSCLVLSSVRLACLVIRLAVSERLCCCRNHERQQCFVPCVVEFAIVMCTGNSRVQQSAASVHFGSEYDHAAIHTAPRVGNPAHGSCNLPALSSRCMDCLAP